MDEKMTDEEFDAAYDELLKRHETLLAKLSTTSTGSSFTETIDKKIETVRNSLSDSLDLLIERYRGG